MASMCEICKCSTYWNDELDMHSCENGCECCNDPNYESDAEMHYRIMKQIKSYIDLSILSLSQDINSIYEQMESLDPNSKDYAELDFEYNFLSGKGSGMLQILDYIKELE